MRGGRLKTKTSVKTGKRNAQLGSCLLGHAPLQGISKNPRPSCRSLVFDSRRAEVIATVLMCTSHSVSCGFAKHDLDFEDPSCAVCKQLTISLLQLLQLLLLPKCTCPGELAQPLAARPEGFKA